MEDLKTNEQLNNNVEDLPRTPDGKLDLASIAIGKTEKDFYIIPDEIFNNYYKELPAGTVNASGTWRATSTGGKLKILGGDPENDRAIQIKGAETLNATNAQRQSNKEILEIIATMPITEEDEQKLNLPKGTTNLFAVNYAQYRKAKIQRDTQAAIYIRDTLGEKPTDKIDASITGLTAEDKEMIRNMESRLESANDNSK